MKKIAVIGGGIAGLAAAVRIKSKAEEKNYPALRAPLIKKWNKLVISSDT